MKRIIIKRAILCIAIIVVLLISMTSCGVFGVMSTILDMYNFPEFDMELPTDEAGDELPGGFYDPNEKPTGLPNDNFEDDKVIIEGGGNNVSLAASIGLRSAVSVVAEFSAGASSGSGVIYKLDKNAGSAFIITNYHVVYYNSYSGGAISNDINVFLFGMEYADYAIPATFVGGSPNYDIAVLRVDNSEVLKNAAANGGAASIMTSNSDELAAGMTAIAIGNPEAAGISVTSGVVSIDSEYITMPSINGTAEVEFRVIRIDTAVNSGNSGGGLFNDKGELIGIVNAKISKTDVENIAYAIPSNVARAIADNIIDYCYGRSCKTVMRALIGVTVSAQDLKTEYDKESGLIKISENVVVVEVSESGLANGKIFADDVITKIRIADKTIEVTRRHHLIDAMLDARVGDTVDTTVIRNGEEVTVSIKITEECLSAY